jgi:excisionase family DNA binding protein
MKDVTPRGAPCHPLPLNDVLTEILGNAIALAVKRPDVIEALRATFSAKAEPPVDPDALLSKAQLAKKLAVSVSTIDRLTARGMPVAAHVGDHRRYRLADVEAWLAAQEAAQ